MSASIPAAASRTISLGSFTVQVFTAIPYAWAASTTLAAPSSASIPKNGCTAPCPPSTAIAIASIGVTWRPVR